MLEKETELKIKKFAKKYEKDIVKFAQKIIELRFFNKKRKKVLNL
jgi:hypothetical protein